MKLYERSCAALAALGLALALACAPAVYADDGDLPIASLSLPAWTASLPEANDGLLQALEAIAGEAPPSNLKSLLSGVVKISRAGDGIELLREDNSVLRVERSSEAGRHLLAKIDKAVTKAGDKFGRPASDLIDSFSSITLTGNHVTIERTGGTAIAIETKQKQDKNYWVKEIKLDDLSFDVSEHAGHPLIKNLSGATAVLDALGIPVTLREFERWQDKEGNNVYSVGIKNPLPHQVAGLLGGEVLHLKFTESRGKDRQIITNDTELTEAEKSSTAAGGTPHTQNENSPVPWSGTLSNTGNAGSSNTANGTLPDSERVQPSQAADGTADTAERPLFRSDGHPIDEQFNPNAVPANQAQP